MVRFVSTVFIISTLASTLFAAVTKRTVAQVEADITTITSDAQKLDNDIKAFPNSGGSLVAALGIHTDATTLNTAVNKATNDTIATPGPIAEADGQAVLKQIQGVAPIILDALNAIVQKKAAFAALPIGGIPALVLSDLKTLNASTVAFENALLAVAPSDLLPNATTLVNEINGGFATAIAAYS